MIRWKELQYWSYSLPLQRPLHIGSQTLTRRDGILMQWVDARGFSGWGEICPLPGLHKESFVEALHQVEQLHRVWEDVRVDEDFATAMRRWTWLGAQWDLMPSVQAGLDMLIVNYWMQRQQTSLAGLLGKTPPEKLSMQALLTEPLESLSDAAKERWEQGYRAFKVKVGRLSLKEDIARIQTLHRLFDGEALLRLDANRKWSLEEACAFVEVLDGIQVDYFEEPLSNPHQLPEFKRRVGARYALDECLSEQSPSPSYELQKDASAFVLKPTVLGGWANTQQWIQQAGSHGQTVVFSSSFESGLGLAYLAQWAASLEIRTPVGLDTARWLAEDLWTDWHRGGSVPLSNNPPHPDWDTSKLHSLNEML